MSLVFFRNSRPEQASGEPIRRAKPRIGFVLGAGVARGWAHIGALRELTEMGIVPDVVVGASIGAVNVYQARTREIGRSGANVRV